MIVPCSKNSVILLLILNNIIKAVKLNSFVAGWVNIQAVKHEILHPLYMSHEQLFQCTLTSSCNKLYSIMYEQLFYLHSLHWVYLTLCYSHSLSDSLIEMFFKRMYCSQVWCGGVTKAIVVFVCVLVLWVLACKPKPTWALFCEVATLLCCAASLSRSAL